MGTKATKFLAKLLADQNTALNNSMLVTRKKGP